MGYTRSTSYDWAAYSSTTKTKTRSQIYSSTGLNTEMDPMGQLLRESRDSEANPESTPIMVALDVTGSMGHIAELIAKEGLSKLFTEIYERKPVTDPQIMPLALGDAEAWDRAPLQIGQFEADLMAAEWLEKIYLEGGGGGNGHESYDLPVYYAAYHTSHDAFEKRNKKGFLFTIGDEPPPRMTRIESIKKVLDAEGDGLMEDVTFKKVIEDAQKMYHYYHIIIGDGWHAKNYPDQVRNEWRELLGENAVWLKDHTALPETIISILEVMSGKDADEVAASWSGSTAVAVRDAIKDLSAADRFDAANGVVRL